MRRHPEELLLLRCAAVEHMLAVRRRELGRVSLQAHQRFQNVEGGIVRVYGGVQHPTAKLRLARVGSGVQNAVQRTILRILGVAGS